MLLVTRTVSPSNKKHLTLATLYFSKLNGMCVAVIKRNLFSALIKRNFFSPIRFVVHTENRVGYGTALPDFHTLETPFHERLECFKYPIESLSNHLATQVGDLPSLPPSKKKIWETRDSHSKDYL